MISHKIEFSSQKWFQIVSSWPLHESANFSINFVTIIYIEKGESEQSNLSDKAVLDTIKGKIKFVLTWNCTNELFEISKNKLRILKHMVTASACTEHSSLLHFDKLRYYN